MAKVSMQTAIEEFGVWGPVIAVHNIGEYAVVEYWSRPAANSVDKRTRKCFGSMVKGVRTSHSFNTMDEALAHCISYKYEGPNGKAAHYFMKGILNGSSIPVFDVEV